MGTQVQAEAEFNSIQFEKKLTGLKDSQESINQLCKWCLEKDNRTHHKKIVNCWLNVLKRVKVEQRLVLFYLANDVIQYSKRRRYEYVESWGTALQKATTMVREDRVKHKILRIFKIWEERGVYDSDFIADLCGLISVTPSTPKNDEPHEFQSNHVVKKIRFCSTLENDTDLKLKILKEHNPKIQIDNDLISSLKDRAHVDDVEREIDVYAVHMEGYVNALKLEIKNRINLITVLKQAETQLETDKKDVKLVANAYRTFATRVKTFQKKLAEHRANLISPVPSPDINAPSPSPDSDLELPEDDSDLKNTAEFMSLQFSNPGYYNPVPPPPATTELGSNFPTNGYTNSFLGGSTLPFNIQNFDPTSLFSNNDEKQKGDLQNTNNTSNQQPLTVDLLGNSSSGSGYAVSYSSPLMPPPMPPFSKNNGDYQNRDYAYTSASTGNNFVTTDSFDPSTGAYSTYGDPSLAVAGEYPSNDYSFNTLEEPPPGANPYPPSDDYNPEQEPTTWEQETWEPPPEPSDTPESPPMFEREAYGDPIEYHDGHAVENTQDVDQRVIPIIPVDSDDSLGRGKDIDHRNLIGLTGSPGDSNSNVPSSIDTWQSAQQADQDYRIPPLNSDQDYRVPPFNIEQLKLPPPPPPPPKPTHPSPSRTLTTIDTSNPTPHHGDVPPPPPPSSGQKSDIVESIDMDLSDDDNVFSSSDAHHQKQNLKVIVDSENEYRPSADANRKSQVLEPPPPFPDLPEDEDANLFLDDLDRDINTDIFLADAPEGDEPMCFEGAPLRFPNLPNLSDRFEMENPFEAEERFEMEERFERENRFDRENRFELENRFNSLPQPPVPPMMAMPPGFNWMPENGPPPCPPPFPLRDNFNNNFNNNNGGGNNNNNFRGRGGGFQQRGRGFGFANRGGFGGNKFNNGRGGGFGENRRGFQNFGNRGGGFRGGRGGGGARGRGNNFRGGF